MRGRGAGGQGRRRKEVPRRFIHYDFLVEWDTGGPALHQHKTISADPGLRQGRGGAWDHRRCGTFPTRPARKSYHKATAMAQGHLPAAAMASYSQNPPNAPKVRIAPQGHLPAAAMASYRRSRLPFARPQTLQTLQNPPNAPKVRIAPQGQGTPTSPTRATSARKSHHKATAMAQGHLPAAAMASYRRSRLPFARPQTLQTLQNPPNAPKVRIAPQGQGTPTSLTKPSKTLQTQGHLPAAAMASYRRSRLPFARPQTLQNPPNAPKVRIAPQGQGTPTSPTRATPARKSHHKATAMAQGHLPAAAMASYRRSRLPFARPQTLQTLQNPPSAPKVRIAPQGQGTPTSLTKPSKTLQTQGHLPAAAMASYRRSRLPFARPQTLQTLQKFA